MFRVKEPHPRLLRSEILEGSFGFGNLRDRIAKRCFIFLEVRWKCKAGRLAYTEEAKRDALRTRWREIRNKNKVVKLVKRDKSFECLGRHLGLPIRFSGAV